MVKLFTASTMLVKGEFRYNVGLIVKDGEIVDMGLRTELETLYPSAEVVDFGHKAMVPGTVNAHNHSFQSLLRGMAVDVPFLQWRDEALYRCTPFLNEQAIYTGALFAFAEMMKCGVTTVADFFYVHNGGIRSDEAVIQAAKDIGIRLVFARTMYDWQGAPESYIETVRDAVKRTKQLAVRYQGDDMISIHPAPHSPHAASPEMIQAGHKLALELGTPFHIHVAEEPFEVEETLEKYSLRPVHYLDSLDVVDDNMIAIHLVWIDPSEIKLLGERKTSLAYCPSSNMFLSDGVTPIPDLLDAGVKIALGTDGACSNNRISVFEEMRMCSLLQKVSRLDGTCIDAKNVFQMGTTAGADLLKLETGELKIGLRADFAVLDVEDLSLLPNTELFANMVYSMQPTAITDVVVDGKLVVENRRLKKVSEHKLVRQVNQLVERW
ncbi:amidohydrolase family protein [Alkalicoccobacillus porphyridii]|uniref:Amidohydrolase n=1 Tax=Alkalicoccobacillus porphyridii TaxID=2597270 RepID=A0A554A1Q4_9BACI|nr:amidohydrolase [Alkalicoccobacillus porphyridii]TSB47615.1 amidohydrolase [Alkalicoccobacillus porphyridii]